MILNKPANASDALKELFKEICLNNHITLTEWKEDNNDVYFKLTKRDRMGYKCHFSNTIKISEINCEKIKKIILNHFNKIEYN